MFITFNEFNYVTVSFFFIFIQIDLISNICIINYLLQLLDLKWGRLVKVDSSFMNVFNIKGFPCFKVDHMTMAVIHHGLTDISSSLPFCSTGIQSDWLSDAAQWECSSRINDAFQTETQHPHLSDIAKVQFLVLRKPGLSNYDERFDENYLTSHLRSVHESLNQLLQPAGKKTCSTPKLWRGEREAARLKDEAWISEQTTFSF